MKGPKSVSMYAPNKQMAVSKMMASSVIDPLKGKSMLATAPGRKVQGHDLARTTKTNFEQTVNNLKSKPTQKVLEDQYINGLQEQIKYLQYELKLLKDKEILQREGVNQLDNFLKDEIPINQNILAMKNKYNATKEHLQKRLSSLNLKKGEAQQLLQTQKNQIDRLHKIIDAHRQQKDDRRIEFKQKMSDLVKQISLSIDQYDSVRDDNKRMQELIKMMNDQISVIQRNIQKEKVSQVRATEQKTKKTAKFQQIYQQTTQKLIESSQQCQQLRELQQDVNPLLAPLQQQNSLLRKRLMLNEKQKSTAQNNIAEIQLILKEQQRERQIQRQHKFKYLAAGQQSRLQVQKLERDGDNILKDKTLRTKKKTIKEINNTLGQREDVYELLTSRLVNLEQNCTNLIQQKRELQSQIEDQNKQEKELLEAIANTEEEITKNRSTAESLKRITQELQTQTLPFQNNLQKFKGRIPIVQKDIGRKNTTIHYLNKQIQLLKELKGLDLEHIQLISNGQAKVHTMLNSFIRNWEKIKSQ